MGFLDFLKPRLRGFRAAAKPEGLATYPLWVHPEETGSRLTREIVHTGRFEPFETMLMQRLLPHFELFIEAAAGVGWYTALAQRVMKPGSEIHAFEPDRRNFSLLKRNAEAGAGNDRRITTRLTRAALADRAGTVRLFDWPGDFGVHSRHASEASHHSVSVPATTLDACFAGRALPPLLAKVDARGGEPWIFRGGSSVLSPRQKGSVFILEFWPNGVLGSGEDAAAFAASFSRHAQQPFVIYHETGGLRPITWEELGGHTRGGVATTRRYALDILAITPGTPAYFAVSDLIAGY
jgi:FkbM family methyltransferase